MFFLGRDMSQMYKVMSEVAGMEGMDEMLKKEAATFKTIQAAPRDKPRKEEAAAPEPKLLCMSSVPNLPLMHTYFSGASRPTFPRRCCLRSCWTPARSSSSQGTQRLGHWKLQHSIRTLILVVCTISSVSVGLLRVLLQPRDADSVPRLHRGVCCLRRLVQEWQGHVWGLLVPPGGKGPAVKKKQTACYSVIFDNGNDYYRFDQSTAEQSVTRL